MLTRLISIVSKPIKVGVVVVVVFVKKPGTNLKNTVIKVDEMLLGQILQGQMLPGPMSLRLIC